jgi:hypothetical protein
VAWWSEPRAAVHNGSHTELPAGRYVITIKAIEPGGKGDYTLTVSKPKFTDSPGRFALADLSAEMKVLRNEVTMLRKKVEELEQRLKQLEKVSGSKQ